MLISNLGKFALGNNKYSFKLRLDFLRPFQKLP